MAITKLNKSFVEVTGERLDVNSQLQLYSILKDEETKEKFLNIFRSYYVNEDDVKGSLLYELYSVDLNDWWENIAYEYYNDVTVWWIIPLINNITNPFEFPEAGEMIYVLKPIYLNKILDEIYKIGKK